MTRHTRREFLAVAGGAGATALVVAFRPWRVLVETASAAAPPERLRSGTRRARGGSAAPTCVDTRRGKVGLLAGLVTVRLRAVHGNQRASDADSGAPDRKSRPLRRV